MPSTAKRHPLLARDVARSYLSIGAAIVLAAVAFLAGVPRLAYFGGWTAFCVVYVVLSLVAFLRLDAGALREVTAASDPGVGSARRIWWALSGGGGISWALAGSVVTLVVLLTEATQSGGRVPLEVIGGSVTVVIATVALMIVAFAVHYAREDAVFGGLSFPGTEHPRFDDYLYLSVQLTTTFGGSDVVITGRRMRRTISMHSLIAFSFNAVIVALLASVLVAALT